MSDDIDNKENKSNEDSNVVDLNTQVTRAKNESIFGRPTLYSEALCRIAIEEGRKGKTKTQIAVKIGISRATLYDWIDNKPDFSDTIDMATTLAQDYWENIQQAKVLGQEQKKEDGKNHFDIDKVSERGLEFRLKNSYRSDWGDNSKVEHTGNMIVNLDKDDSQL